MDFERFLHWFEMFKSRFRTEKFFSGTSSYSSIAFVLLFPIFTPFFFFYLKKKKKKKKRDNNNNNKTHASVGIYSKKK
jgi:hypothetical protein